LVYFVVSILFIRCIHCILYLVMIFDINDIHLIWYIVTQSHWCVLLTYSIYYSVIQCKWKHCCLLLPMIHCSN
jgi:hypothetical protein